MSCSRPTPLVFPLRGFGFALLTKNQRGRASDFPGDRHQQQRAGAATGEIDADNGGNDFSCRGHYQGPGRPPAGPNLIPTPFGRRALTDAPARLEGGEASRPGHRCRSGAPSPPGPNEVPYLGTSPDIPEPPAHFAQAWRVRPLRADRDFGRWQPAENHLSGGQAPGPESSYWTLKRLSGSVGRGKGEEGGSGTEKPGFDREPGMIFAPLSYFEKGAFSRHRRKRAVSQNLRSFQ